MRSVAADSAPSVFYTSLPDAKGRRSGKFGAARPDPSASSVPAALQDDLVGASAHELHCRHHFPSLLAVRSQQFLADLLAEVLLPIVPVFLDPLVPEDLVLESLHRRLHSPANSAPVEPPECPLILKTGCRCGGCGPLQRVPIQGAR